MKPEYLDQVQQYVLAFEFDLIEILLIVFDNDVELAKDNLRINKYSHKEYPLKPNQQYVE